MGLFKNEVGRPSNDTLKKRRILLLTILAVAVVGIGACVFYTVNYFKGEDVTGEDKNMTTAFFDAYLGLSSSTDIVDSLGETYPKNTYADLENGFKYYLVDMSSTATLKVRAKYLDYVLKGKTKNKKKYYYQVQVTAYSAGDKKMSATAKKDIKSKTITQTLTVKNTISYITIRIYDASSARKVVESKSFAVLPKNVNKNLNKVFKDPTLRACVLDAYNSKFSTSKVDLTNTELAMITVLNCPRSKTDGYILDTTGIAKLTGLTELILSGHGFSSINVTKNTKLIKLDVSNNKLSSINLKNNTRLKSLFIKGNNIKSLDLSKNTKLTQVSSGLPKSKIKLGKTGVILFD